jgi:hypothetical protein
VDINVKIKKMKKIIKLTEDDLTRIIKRVIRETDETQHQEPSAELIASLSSETQDDEKDDEKDMTQQVAEDLYRRRMDRRILNEDDVWEVIKKIKSCYANAGKPFPGPCEKGTHSVCKEKIRITATSFFENNKNAQNDPRIEKFWGCINKVDSSILQGMG